MGIKRKASELEEVTYHPPSSPPSLVSASTQSSPSSMCTEPYNLSFSTTQWGIKSEQAPWLNVRTRKRVRDNRPAEEDVHSNTIKLLFDAQRRNIDDEPLVDLDAMAMDTDLDMDLDVSAGIEDSVIQLPPEHEPNQRSLHDFFSTDRSKSLPNIQSSIHDFFSRQAEPPQLSSTGFSTPFDFLLPGETTQNQPDRHSNLNQDIRNHFTIYGNPGSESAHFAASADAMQT